MNPLNISDVEAVLAFDTSNYTTSIAVMDLSGNLLAHHRHLLSVEDGKRGLRQSDALFQHVQRLPLLMEKLAPDLKGVTLKAIGYSDRPRRVEGSYMPVFLAGETVARSLSASHGIPCYAFSHQEGHIAAGLWSLGLKTETPFYALHLSGGTTELLKVAPQPDVGFDEEIIGATADISLGQLIDRTGVALGLPFPAGPALEKLALACEEEPFDIPFSIKSNLPVKIDKINIIEAKKTEVFGQFDEQTLTQSDHLPLYHISLSGPETHVQRLLATESPERIALSLFHFAGKLLARLVKKAQTASPLPMLLSVGGVASNSIVRRVLEEELDKSSRNKKSVNSISLLYALPTFCSDNAVGTAALTLQSLELIQ